MKPQDFLKEYKRMCKIFYSSCKGCPLFELPCGVNMPNIEPDDFAEMYDAVSEWSDSHPIKTR